MELSFHWLTIFWFRGARRSFMGDSSSHHSFNTSNTWRVLVGSASGRRRHFVFRAFFLLYIWCILLLISSISTLLIFERESSSPSLSSTCPLLPSAYPWFTNDVTFKAVLPPKANSSVSSFSFFFHIFAFG